MTSMLNQPRPVIAETSRLDDTRMLFCTFGSPLYSLPTLSDKPSKDEQQRHTTATGAVETALTSLRMQLRRVDGLREVHFDGPEFVTFFCYERAIGTPEALEVFRDRLNEVLLRAADTQPQIFPELPKDQDVQYTLTDTDPATATKPAGDTDESTDDEVADRQPTAIDTNTQFTSEDVLLLLRFCRRLNSMRMAAILSARAKADVVFITEAAKKLLEDLYGQKYSWDEVLDKLIDIAPLLRYAAELLRGLDFHPDYIDPCVPDAALLLLLEAKAYNRSQKDDVYITEDGLIGVNSPEGVDYRASLTPPDELPV